MVKVVQGQGSGPLQYHLLHIREMRGEYVQKVRIDIRDLEIEPQKWSV